MAENFFKFHPEAEINALACNLIADKYQLSSIFSKVAISENVMQEVAKPNERQLLDELVPQLLCELKYNIIEERMKAIPNLIKETTDENEQFKLLKEQQTLKELHTKLSAYLGNRMR